MGMPPARKRQSPRWRAKAVSVPSLLEVLQSVPDPRDRRGRQHPLPAILSLTVVAVLAGMKSLSAIAQFGRERGAAFAFALGFTKGKTPAKSCLSELFAALDVAALESALSRWLLGRLACGWEAIAIDGKTLKGSADGAVPAVHLPGAFAPDAGAVLAQMRVDAKTNEHKAALRLLGVLPLAGKVVSGDAMFTHKDVARKIRQAGGDYVLIVKDNQATLKRDIHAALPDDAGFSPLPAEAQGGGGAASQDDRQGARPARAAAAAEHDAAGRLPGLAGRPAGLRAGARAHPG
jgi:hypothetical protein